MHEYLFRRLTEGDDTAGHAVWMEAFLWLQERGIRQWVVPLPFEAFQQRTSDGRNYGLFDKTDLLAVVALSFQCDDHWTDLLGMAPRWWLGALAVRSSARGRGLGRRTVANAFLQLEQSEAREVYLDCVEGELQGYYESLGFKQMGAKRVTYASGNTFPMVLLRAPLLPRSSKGACS